VPGERICEKKMRAAQEGFDFLDCGALPPLCLDCFSGNPKKTKLRKSAAAQKALMA
jgi:hypothetical protein